MADNNDKALQKFEHAFEGHQVTTIRYRGRECWVARQIGEALGYSDGGRGFVTSVTRDWSGEMIVGDDYEVVKGEDARNLAELFRSEESSLLAETEGTSKSIPFDNPRGALVLFESGLNIAAMKTEKPAGRTLRRWLATEVLPAIRRTGAYAVTGGGAGAGTRALPSPASKTARAMRREARRFEGQGMRAAAEHLRLSALEALVDRAMPEVRAVLAAELAAAEDRAAELAAAEGGATGRAGEAPALPAPASKAGKVDDTAGRPKRRGRSSTCIKKRYNVSVKVGSPRSVAQPQNGDAAGAKSSAAPAATAAEVARKQGPWGRPPGSVSERKATATPAAATLPPQPTYVTHPEDRDEELSRDGFPSVAEWRAFLEAWWATFGARVVGTHHLVSMCAKRSMLGHFIGTGSERSRLTRLGILVARRTDLVEEVFATTDGSESGSDDGTERRGFRVRIERSLNRRSKVSMFRLVRVVPE